MEREETEQKVAKETKNIPVSRQGVGYVERRVAEDAAQVVRHDGVRICGECHERKPNQTFCNRCQTMICTACCRACPERSNRND